MGVRYHVLIAAVAVAGCGMGGDVPSGLVAITVRNRSQFELLELRFHSTPAWSETANLLEVPLGVEQSLPLVFQNGDYVTAMRRKIEVGEVIAISSAAPLPPMADGSLLIVFDMSFRIETPEPYEPPEETSTTASGSMR